jgi:hypothetical protein
MKASDSCKIQVIMQKFYKNLPENLLLESELYFSAILSYVI